MVHIGKELSKNRIELEDKIGDTIRECANLDWDGNTKEVHRLNEDYCKDFCDYYELCLELVLNSMEKVTPLFKLCEGCSDFDEFIRCTKEPECKMRLENYLGGEIKE